jgi:hypothetical protein
MFTHCLVSIYECLLPNPCPCSKASIFVCVSGCHVTCYPLRTQQQFWTYTVQSLLTGPQPVTLCSGQTPCRPCYPVRSQSLCVLDNHRAVLATRSAASHSVEWTIAIVYVLYACARTLWCGLVFRIPKVLGQIFDVDSNCPDCDFYGCSLRNLANADMVPSK